MKNRKRFPVLVLVVLTISLSACGTSGNTGNEQAVSQTTNNEKSQDTVTEENAALDENESAGTTAGNNILIAYFTAAENSGVDAEASASYSTVDGENVGRLRAIAEMIQKNVGGELFSIQTEEEYPADIGDVIDQAADEQSEDARPALSTHIENLDNYDTIFVGYPNWWADLPQPLYTFFDEYDFSGKTIIPFNTHNGSGLSRTVGTIEELEPDAVVTEGFTIHESEVPAAADDVADWLSEIGF